MALRSFIIILLCFSLNSFGQSDSKTAKDPKVLFDSRGESAAFNSVKGSWRSYEFEGQKMIRLSPEPITHGRIDLGPILPSYDINVSAKVLGKEKRRLKPRMGVGVFGEYGFTLRLAPGRNMLELAQYGEVIAESPCDWNSSVWQFIELKVRAQKTHWILEGTTWKTGQKKPDKPSLVHRAYPATLTHPLSGRAFLTGSPYNGFPIFFDEVVVRRN